MAKPDEHTDRWKTDPVAENSTDELDDMTEEQAEAELERIRREEREEMPVDSSILTNPKMSRKKLNEPHTRTKLRLRRLRELVNAYKRALRKSEMS
ncbi:hypothetical protein P7H22_10625 [Paenibacillus larvae]|nr:hypothetical protein [Paenibacillus larvae]MDT2240697.1 hypothetical protein [Paenibacillus larvae]